MSALMNSMRPAFPGSREIRSDVSGLTKREELARTAMLGLLMQGGSGRGVEPQTVAEDAVTYADALLAELARRE